VKGVLAARQIVDDARLDIDIGFKWAYRHPVPSEETRFWEHLRDEGGEEFAAALDFVGADLYTIAATMPDPNQPVADHTLNMIAELRECLLPIAGISDSVEVWVTEAGAADQFTGVGEPHAEALADMVTTAYDYSESYNITQWLQWKIECGPPPPADRLIQDDCTGLIDYESGEVLPAYETWKNLVASNGASPYPTAGPAEEAGPKETSTPESASSAVDASAESSDSKSPVLLIGLVAAAFLVGLAIWRATRSAT
jgi:hypothetical protein